jgi:hypothetical protein
MMWRKLSPRYLWMRFWVEYRWRRKTPAAQHAELTELSRMIRDATSAKLGIWVSDEELDLNVRFTMLRSKHERDECFTEWLTSQLYVYLPIERKRQIVDELTQYSERKSNR